MNIEDFNQKKENLTIDDILRNVISYINSSNEDAVINPNKIKIGSSSIFEPGYNISGKLNSVGGKYKSSQSGSRVEIHPTKNIGIRIIDDEKKDVFKAIVGGEQIGDVVIGNYDEGQGILYDKSENKTTFAGTITSNAGLIGGWSISSNAIYFDGATDAVSSGMSSLDYPFYAGKKYVNRASAPFRVTSAGALYASSATITGAITTGAGSNINGYYINNQTITHDKIAANAIYGDVIAASAITAEKIDAGAVTAGKIASNAITSEKIASNAITSEKIDAGAVTAGKIASNAITSEKIASNAITSDKIEAGAVTAGKISVTTLSAIKSDLGTITAGSISGVTITGGTIQTSTTGKRVILDGTNNAVRFFDSNGTEQGNLYGGGSGMTSTISCTAHFDLYGSNKYLFASRIGIGFNNASPGYNLTVSGTAYAFDYYGGGVFLKQLSTYPGPASSYRGYMYYDTTKSDIVFSNGSNWYKITATLYDQ